MVRLKKNGREQRKKGRPDEKTHPTSRNSLPIRAAHPHRNTLYLEAADAARRNFLS